MTKKKKSYVPVGKLKKHLRRLSYQRKEYTEAKNRAKIDKATFECEECGQVMYDGKSEASLARLRCIYPDIVQMKPELDHEKEVVDKEKGWQGWDEFINRLFCGPDELKVLCKPCHKGVSKEEMAERKKAGSLKRNKDEIK